MPTINKTTRRPQYLNTMPVPKIFRGKLDTEIDYEIYSTKNTTEKQSIKPAKNNTK